LKRSKLNQLLNWAGFATGIVGVVFVLFRLSGFWHQMDISSLFARSMPFLTTLILIYGAANLLMAMAWREILKHFNIHTSVKWAIQTYGIAQIGKYIPGNIFQFAGRQAIGQSAGLEAKPLAKSAVWEIGLLAFTGLLFPVLSVPLFWDQMTYSVSLLLFLLESGVAFLILNYWIGNHIGSALIYEWVFLVIAGLVFNGVLMMTTSATLGSNVSIMGIAGVYVLAWLAGMLTPGAPAGIGVREVVFLAMLHPVVRENELLKAIIIGRIVTISGDVVFYLFSMCMRFTLPGKAIAKLVTIAWWHLPLTRTNKERMKSAIFRTLPFFFRTTRVYRQWVDAKSWTDSANLPKTPDTVSFSKTFARDSNKEPEYRQEAISADPVTSVAIIVHAFHFDVFLEIMEYLKNNQSIKFSFYVTAPKELTEKITGFFKTSSFDFFVLPVENRGRDILPFLTIVNRAFADGHQVVLKVHTKKSDHRLSGDLWRKDLFQKLLTDSSVSRALQLLNNDKTVGIIGASGHLVPMNLYYGANAARIERLGEALGISRDKLTHLNFPAGSMFFARKQALIPLLNLDIKANDFEVEAGQKDGTLAHAIERAFAISAMASGLKTVDSSFIPGKSKLEIARNHPFTH
jgi:hypothetical protein